MSEPSEFRAELERFEEGLTKSASRPLEGCPIPNHYYWDAFGMRQYLPLAATIQKIIESKRYSK